MKFLFTSILAIFGIFLIVAAVFIPTFAFVIITPVNSGNLTVINMYPSSTDPNNPTIFSNYNYANIAATLQVPVNNYTLQGYPTIKTAELYINNKIFSCNAQILNVTLQNNTYYAIIQANYNFSNPSIGKYVVYSFAFYMNVTTGNEYYAGLTLPHYGAFPLTPVQNIGDIYIVSGANITKANYGQTLFYNATNPSLQKLYTFPYKSPSAIEFSVYYVEDHGTTTNLSQIYVMVNGNTYFLQKTMFEGYPAYYTKITVSVNTTESLNFYVITINQQTISLGYINICVEPVVKILSITNIFTLLLGLVFLTGAVVVGVRYRL